MAITINFPSDPTVGQQYTYAGKTWQWNGTVWLSLGIQGIQGTQGLGNQGVQGTIGIQGGEGYIGLDGSQGVQGTQGLQGLQGQIGIQGNEGYIGLDGAQGYIGSQGAIGIQGSIGGQGILGTQGSIGSQGDVGIQGNLGIQGVQGTQGGFGISTVNIAISKTTDYDIAYPQLFKYPVNLTVASVILLSNCSEVSIIIGGTTYNHTTLVGITLTANTEMIIDDITIASGDSANAIIILNP